MLPAAYLALAAAGLCAVWGAWLLVPRDLDARLSAGTATSARPRGLSALLPRVDDRLGRWLEERMGPNRVARVEQRLVAAGILGRQAVHDHLGRRATYLALAAGFGLLALLAAGNFLILPIGLVAAWFTSQGSLDAAVRHRSIRIESDLPDFLDVVAVMLSAGLGFRDALGRVAEAMPGPVAEEIAYVLRQIELGVPLRETLTELRGRNQSEAFDKFVASLLQADELGSPLSDALIALASDIRRGAAQTARRRAAQTAPRVSLVLTLVIVPASVALLVSGLIIGSEVDFGEIFRS